MLRFRQDVFDTFKYNKHGERNNKIILSLFKSGRWIFNFGFHTITDMTSLENQVIRKVKDSIMPCDFNYIYLMDDSVPFKSSRFLLDDKNGICEEDDCESYVIYIDQESGKPYKMRAGKFMRALILETLLGNKLPEPVINYLCETFTLKWTSWVIKNKTRYVLHVNRNFSDIYDSFQLIGDFDSCMTDNDRFDFYSNSVSAKAAYITDSFNNDMIAARAIIFDDVKDEGGRKWRLCERQYSTDGDDRLKQLLVNKLYDKGYIDAHKRVGAGCGDARAFINKEGDSLEYVRFRISCDLDVDDNVSYQDSFKYYDLNNRVAYNKDFEGSFKLDITAQSLAEDAQVRWDSYHGYYCERVCNVFRGGYEETCDENNLEDFKECFDGDYHHVDDVEDTEDCGYCVREQCIYSDLLNKWYKRDFNRVEAEFQYKRENWLYCHIDDDYVEEESQKANDVFLEH